MKVAIEPENVSDMDALIEGLRLLNRADAFVEVSLTETGEHVPSRRRERYISNGASRICANDSPRFPSECHLRSSRFERPSKGAGRRRRRRRMDA